jgi:prephenate dehydrogenase
VNRKKEIGIIGYGRFGKFLARYLAEDFKLTIYDKNINQTSVEDYKDDVNKNLIFSSLEKTASKNIVILSVPIGVMEKILKIIRKYLCKDTVLLDVCSVKEYPVRLMKKLLPASVSILGTHPLFGPDSAKYSIEGKTVVLCPVRIPKNILNSIKKYLLNKGLIVLESTPKKHDELTAWTLCLSHFIGRGLLDIKEVEIFFATKTYLELKKIGNIVSKDSEELFYDMMRYNKYTKIMRLKILKNFSLINKKIEKKQ